MNFVNKHINIKIIKYINTKYTLYFGQYLLMKLEIGKALAIKGIENNSSTVVTTKKKLSFSLFKKSMIFVFIDSNNTLLWIKDNRLINLVILALFYIVTLCNISNPRQPDKMAILPLYHRF